MNIGTRLSKYLLPISFAILLIAAGLAYPRARDIMIIHQPWLYVWKSNVTLNFALFFFLWGILSDLFTKNRSRRVQWTVFASGLIALILLFKFIGGYPTIF